MKVLLTRPVDKLGETGEIVEVAPGYARNYLLPKGLALEPTPHNVKRLEKARLAREAELRTREEQARKLHEQLDGQSFVFRRTAQEEGKLYGSVRPEDIVAAVEERTGFHLERDRVKLGEALDAVGTFPVTLNLYKDIHATIQVVVEAEGLAPAEGSLEEEAAQEKGAAQD